MIWLTMAGCYASLPKSARTPQNKEWDAVEATMQAWLQSGLSWTPKCTEQFQKIQIIITEPEEFHDLCGRYPVGGGGKLYACNTEQYEIMWPFGYLGMGGKVPLLVISDLQSEGHQKDLIIHESLHWLERCSGRGVDFDHAGELVWTKTRLEARRILKEAWNQKAREAPPVAICPNHTLPPAAAVGTCEDEGFDMEQNMSLPYPSP